MDKRRLSTADVMADGILEMPMPRTDIPKHRKELAYDIYEPMGSAEFISELDKGKVIDCSEYYGIPVVWREGERYRAILLQYRSITENHTFESAEDAYVWLVETAATVAE